jgi:hypothetical protein
VTVECPFDRVRQLLKLVLASDKFCQAAPDGEFKVAV